MADASEDALLQPGPLHAAATDPSNDAGDDEVHDFRFFHASSQKLPSRGEKDFEPHGTNLQRSTLDSSREAMAAALQQTRFHHRDAARAVYDPAGGGAWVVRNVAGKWTVTTGRSRRDADNEPRLWLLPEEALWLIERGSLDIRWPARRDEGEEEHDGLPMSLQGAYAAFVGFENSGLTLEMFKVYQHLKRAGFIVLRAEDNLGNVPSRSGTAALETPSLSFWTIFSRLWRGLMTHSDPPARLSLGPLVKPGLYRSYDSIFRLLTCVPFHDPNCAPTRAPGPASSQLKVTYHVYKSVADYKKTAPGPPDFYVCVLDAREGRFPTESELDYLLGQTPLHTRDPNLNMYRRLKDGYRNILLAVVDQGVVSFVKVSDACFGGERLWERAPRRGGRGGGGGHSKGRHRGKRGS